MKKGNHVVKGVKPLVSSLFMDESTTVPKTTELETTDLHSSLVTVYLQVTDSGHKILESRRGRHRLGKSRRCLTAPQ